MCQTGEVEAIIISYYFSIVIKKSVHIFFINQPMLDFFFKIIGLEFDAVQEIVGNGDFFGIFEIPKFFGHSSVFGIDSFEA